MIRASTQDGSYPRPQLVRESWVTLDGEWEFAYDDDDAGLAGRWFEAEAEPLPLRIEVPFAPESQRSGVGGTGAHPVLWYRREFQVSRAGDERVVLHFGAVDHLARVWVDGQYVGEHVGGHTSFRFDVTDALAEGDRHIVTVRAFDDPSDLEVPRGKQDWRDKPHAIWYTRTSGIWQSVWLEVVPAVRIESIAWESDLVAGTVTAEVALSSRMHPPLQLEVSLDRAGEALAATTVDVVDGAALVTLRPRGLRAGHVREELHWSPENPVLIDAQLELRGEGGAVDTVASYLGVRSVGVAGGAFQLNGVPYFVRAVLEQGYWPDSLMTAPSTAALRDEVELIKRLGFNTARVHQKSEDPRFLYWADRLGLMLWGESAAAYDFSPRAARLLVDEWADTVQRDRSHPSIVAWVPINESWGVQDIARSSAQRAFVQSITSLTRALDASRPVISNDGWEHVDSDILTIHDYSADARMLRKRYGTREGVEATLMSRGPQGRVISLSDELSARVRAGSVPVMVSEFGGVSFAGDSGTWGYATVRSTEEYQTLLAELFSALTSGGTGGDAPIVGFCYTQLTDTGQEANGLVRADRSPKLPLDALREIVTGRTRDGHHFVWPPVTE